MPMNRGQTTSVAKRREPTPLKLVRAAAPIDPDSREPAPSLHGHFPLIPFRKHQRAVGASYKPHEADASLRGDQRIKRLRIVDDSDNEVSSAVPEEGGELPMSVEWRQQNRPA